MAPSSTTDRIMSVSAIVAAIAAVLVAAYEARGQMEPTGMKIRPSRNPAQKRGQKVEYLFSFIEKVFRGLTRHKLSRGSGERKWGSLEAH